jgi:hypothetical protein
MATMEEKIRKAMAELGLDPDGGDTNDKPTKVTVKTKQLESTKKESVSKPTQAVVPNKKADVSEKPKRAAVVTEKKVETQTDVQVPQSIFMKISGNHMVLLIPEGLELDKQVIGGNTYNTVAVQVPDFGGKLYEMPLINTAHTVSKSNTVVRVPIIMPKTEPSQSSNDEYLENLLKEKSRLDAEIKAARASHDDNLVNDLRKQRRSIRARINHIVEG